MLLACVLLPLLGFAAWRDVATRTIPDVISVSIVATGLYVRAAEGWHAMALSALAGAILFCLLIPLHARGMMGGGDLKLLAAIAFGVSPLASYRIVAVVVLAGGVLGLVYYLLHRWARGRPISTPRPARNRSVFARVVAIEAWRIRKSAPLPYAVAIAIGTSIVLLGLQGV